jgi:intracellular septation protein
MSDHDPAQDKAKRPDAADDAHLFERDPSDPKRKHINPVLKMALELGPLLVFFFANARGDWIAERVPLLADLGGPIFVGTACFMIATAIALSVSWTLTRTLPIMPLVSGIIVLAFGALTLWLQDETFIKVKPTIINTLFGAILLGGLMFGKSLLGYVFDSAFRLDPEGWRKLTYRWGLFFLVMAVVNEVIWRNFSTDFWIAFKVWGNLPLSILFTLTQLPLMQRHALPEEGEEAKGG